MLKANHLWILLMIALFGIFCFHIYDVAYLFENQTELIQGKLTKAHLNERGEKLRIWIDESEIEYDLLLNDSLLEPVFKSLSYQDSVTAVVSIKKFGKAYFESLEINKWKFDRIHIIEELNSSKDAYKDVALLILSVLVINVLLFIKFGKRFSSDTNLR